MDEIRKATLTTCRLSIIAAGAAGMLAAGSVTASAQEAPEGWFKTCNKQENIDVCNVQNLVIAESGQLVTAVSLIQIEGEVNRKVVQVVVPSGRVVPPGIGMQVDGGQAQRLEYVMCLPDRCIAEAPLNDDIVNSFKRGQNVTFTSINFQNQENPVQISLQGFTASYDGDPLVASDLEQRERATQAWLARNREENQRRLLEAQERAKQGN